MLTTMQIRPCVRRLVLTDTVYGISHTTAKRAALARREHCLAESTRCPTGQLLPHESVLPATPSTGAMFINREEWSEDELDDVEESSRCRATSPTPQVLSGGSNMGQSGDDNGSFRATAYNERMARTNATRGADGCRSKRAMLSDRRVLRACGLCTHPWRACAGARQPALAHPAVHTPSHCAHMDTARTPC